MMYWADHTAIIDRGAQIGDKTDIWHHTHIRGSAVIGNNCNIGQGVYIDTNVTIGDNCKIQNYACLYDKTILGNHVFIGPHVCFTNDRYPRSLKWSDEMKHTTIVEDGASIGANCTILPGIQIGSYSIIGAGSVVTKNVPPEKIVFGNPAKIQRSIGDE